MKNQERTWDDLQTRWAAGEHLSADEERTRLELSTRDARAARELALFHQLSDWAAAPRSHQEIQREAELVSEVLDRANVQAGLHLWAVPKTDDTHELARKGVAEKTFAPLTPLPVHSRGSSPRPVFPSPPRRLALSIMLATGLAAGVASIAFGVGVLWHRGHPIGSPASTTSAFAAVDAPGPARTELVLASGEVTLANTGPHAGVGSAAGAGPSGDAQVGRGPLAEGAHVATERGRACIDIDPSIDVCLGERTEIALDSLSGSDVRVRVVHGAVVAELTPRAAGRTFSLLSGNVSATAHGTVFAVEHGSEGGTTSVVVIEGKVEVATLPERSGRIVSSHTRLDLGSTRSSEMLAQVGRGDEARLLALLAPQKLWQDPKLGVLEISAGDEGAWAKVGDEGPFELPLSMYVPSANHHLTMGDKWGVEMGVDVEVAAGATRQVDPRVAKQVEAAALAKVPARSGAGGRTARILLDDARRELVGGHAKEALSLYEQVRAAYPGSPEAFTVLVTMGKIDLDLGSPKQALALFDAYLQRGGPLAPEALGGKIRALRALGRRAEEKEAIEQYLSESPDGFEAPLLQKRLEAL